MVHSQSPVDRTLPYGFMKKQEEEPLDPSKFQRKINSVYKQMGGRGKRK